MRLFYVLLIVALTVLLPFLIIGERFEEMGSFSAFSAWLATTGRRWAWLAALGLLSADLVLPVPATGVMSALGYVYGVWAGGAIAAAGSFISGTTAYALCRQFGVNAAARLMGERDLERGERLFAGPAGGWLVAVSRCLPLLPEVVACMAGLTRMPARRFFPALAAGCLPMGFIFAAIGAGGTERPGLALALSVLVPALCYAPAFWLLKRKPAPVPAEPATPSPPPADP